MSKAMQSDMRIVHYMFIKPVDSKMKCPNGVCDQTMVYDLKKQEAWLKKVKAEWGGHFAPVLTWWEESMVTNQTRLSSKTNSSTRNPSQR